MDQGQSTGRKSFESVACAGGVDAGRRPGGEQEPRCLVVMYHYVRDWGADDPGPESVSLDHSGTRGDVGTSIPRMHGLNSDEFSTQIDRLCAAMEPIDWPTLYAWTCGRRSVPDRCFLLTFDDGLADHAETVLPILARRGLRGVFFVPGAILTTQRLLSAHAIHLLLSTIDDEIFQRELLEQVRRQGGGDVDWMALLDEDAAEVMYHYESPVRAHLKYLLMAVLPIDLRAAAVDALFERHIGSSTRWARHWYLGWDAVVGIESSGHTVGAHGYSHEPYTRLTPAECREDMYHAASVLRAGLGPDIRPFSYPYGRHNDDICGVCRDAGFAHAFTTERLWVSPGNDVFRLPRFDTIDVDAVLERDVPCTQA